MENAHSSKMVINANLHKTNAVPFDDFAKIPTKKISGMISDLAELK